MIACNSILNRQKTFTDRILQDILWKKDKNCLFADLQLKQNEVYLLTHFTFSATGSRLDKGLSIVAGTPT